MLTKQKTLDEIVAYLGMVRGQKEYTWNKLINHNGPVEFSGKSKRNKRSHSSTFLYLFSNKALTNWHKFEISTTVWSFIAGAPLQLLIANTKKVKETRCLNARFEAGHTPITVIDPEKWIKPISTGEWTLVSCTHTPGFELANLQITMPGWAPGQGKPVLMFPGEQWKPQ